MTEHTDVAQNILAQEQPAVTQNFSNLIQAGNPWQEVTFIDFFKFVNF